MKKLITFFVLPIFVLIAINLFAQDVKKNEYKKQSRSEDVVIGKSHTTISNNYNLIYNSQSVPDERFSLKNNDNISNQNTNPVNGLLVTKTWTGAAGDNIFNSANNWNPVGTPASGDDCIITISGIKKDLVISLNNDINVNSLNITFQINQAQQTILVLDLRNFNLIINGDFTANNNSTGNGAHQLQLNVGYGTLSGGKFICGGNAIIDNGTSTKQIFLKGVNTATNTAFEFKGNLTFGPQGVTAGNYFPKAYYFTGTSTQHLTINSTGVGFSSLFIGDGVNTSTVIYQGSQNAFINNSSNNPYYVNFVIDAGASFQMESGKTLNCYISGTTGDNFYYYGTIVLKGISGGFTGSNFPYGFANYYVGINGKEIYNAATGAQSMYLVGEKSHLEINNQNGVTIAGNININKELILTNGILNTKNGTTLNTIYFTSTATPFTHNEETSAGRLVGKAVMNERNVQSPNPLSFLGVSLQGTNENISFTIERISGVPESIVSYGGYSGIACRWHVQTSEIPTIERNVTYYWLSDLDNGKDFNSYDAQVWISEDGSNWLSSGLAIPVPTNPRSVQVQTTTFSFWTASSSDSPLPIKLTSFSSAITGRDIKLNWVTESEENNSGFEIQKTEVRSQETEVWNKVGFVTGKGTKNSPTSYSFEEKNLQTDKYKYRLKQIDYNGNFEYFELNNIIEIGVPGKFDLSQNYPNPFNPVTKINFDIPENGLISLKVYDILGKEVVTLVNELKDAGYYTITFNASGLSSGVYFYRLNANGFSSVKRMVVLK